MVDKNDTNAIEYFELMKYITGNTFYYGAVIVDEYNTYLRFQYRGKSFLLMRDFTRDVLVTYFKNYFDLDEQEANSVFNELRKLYVWW